MPYILSPLIKYNSEGMWQEGKTYTKENIYSISDEKLPPVNYDSHTLKSHSLTHAEGSLHVIKDGLSVDKYFDNKSFFYGECIVVKLKENKYKLIDEIHNIYHWEVTVEDLQLNLQRVLGDKKTFQKLLLTTLNDS